MMNHPIFQYSFWEPTTPADHTKLMSPQKKSLKKAFKSLEKTNPVLLIGFLWLSSPLQLMNLMNSLLVPIKEVLLTLGTNLTEEKDLKDSHLMLNKDSLMQVLLYRDSKDIMLMKKLTLETLSLITRLTVMFILLISVLGEILKPRDYGSKF